MIRHIEIGEAQRPAHFGVYCLTLFSEMENISMSDLLDTLGSLNFSQTMKLIYCGFKAGSIKEKKEVDFSFEDVCGWLDDDLGKLDEVLKIVNETLPRAKKKKIK